MSSPFQPGVPLDLLGPSESILPPKQRSNAEEALSIYVRALEREKKTRQGDYTRKRDFFASWCELAGHSDALRVFLDLFPEELL